MSLAQLRHSRLPAVGGTDLCGDRHDADTSDWPKTIPLNFRQQRFEAGFRFNLVRTRENSEQIARIGGEAAEREGHLDRFGDVVGNWFALMQRTKLLTFFTQSYSQASVIFPCIVVSPAYFAGAVQLGGLMQTASALNSVQRRPLLSWPGVTLIAMAAVVQRLTDFRGARRRPGGGNDAAGGRGTGSAGGQTALQSTTWMPRCRDADRRRRQSRLRRGGRAVRRTFEDHEKSDAVSRARGYLDDSARAM